VENMAGWVGSTYMMTKPEKANIHLIAAIMRTSIEPLGKEGMTSGEVENVFLSITEQIS
jgi:predicted DNA-binding transcriptional regulator